jgi:hypothetical protein
MNNLKKEINYNVLLEIVRKMSKIISVKVNNKILWNVHFVILNFQELIWRPIMELRDL